eukprot:3137220-Amphidinium_carterae.1
MLRNSCIPSKLPLQRWGKQSLLAGKHFSAVMNRIQQPPVLTSRACVVSSRQEHVKQVEGK